MKNKVLGLRILIFLAVIFITGVLFSFSFSVQAASSSPYNYTQLEKIPGFESAGSDLKSFVGSIYKFGIWTVGIAAVLMITIGGFMYLTSAGNTSKMDVAKRVVMDAIIGLIVALAAYLILYVINPDLVSKNIGTSQLGTSQCKSITTGACSVDNLKSACSWDAEKASAICNAESGGVENMASEVDKCTDGNSFSYGLFQINLTCQCKNAFTPVNQSGCVNKACSVSNQSLYNSCVSTYTNASANISKACEVYKSQGWNGWGVNSKCGF